MVERKRPQLDDAGNGRHEPHRFETARVDRPPGLFCDPHAFTWASSLPIGWSAHLDRLFPPRRVRDPAAHRARRRDEDE